MDNKNMTALVSAFVRSYHDKENSIKIYTDKYIQYILTNNEYEAIINNMSNGINYFNPDFKGTKEEAIKWIVNKQIGPSVLGRSAFNKRSLETAIRIGCKQYVVYASGYDTSTIGMDITCFEIDRFEMIEDKKKRLNNNGIDISNIKYIATDFSNSKWIDSVINSSYNPSLISFNSLLGISYYLTKEEFNYMVKKISNIICEGSSILFDYQTLEYSQETSINEKLAKEASEEMKAKYSYREIENLLENNNLKIYEYLDDDLMTKEFFDDYNKSNLDYKVIAPKGVAYILAVKK